MQVLKVNKSLQGMALTPPQNECIIIFHLPAQASLGCTGPALHMGEGPLSQARSDRVLTDQGSGCQGQVRYAPSMRGG